MFVSMNKFKISFIDMFCNKEGIKSRKKTTAYIVRKKLKKIKNKFIINI